MSENLNKKEMIEYYQDIEKMSEFKELVRKRSVFAWILSAIMLGAYCLFILLLAYAPNFVGTPIFSGGTVTYGIPMGIGLILLAIILSGIYVVRANGEFDDLNEKIDLRLSQEIEK